MDDHLRAGVAIYNAGNYHAAHDAWEDYWLELESGTDDEQFLHGLIQFTAAVHHAHGGNWAGATGLAESGRAYLAGLPAEYRGVNVGAIRRYLAALERDPEVIERRSPLALTADGNEIGLDDLGFGAAAVAAEVYAEEGDYDEEPVERAVAYARADLDAGEETSEFLTLVMDFAREADQRGIVHQRLAEHVRRRRSRENDVEGLFE
ncbi:DUF309 domain-containing protein [Halobacteriales archaeon QS_1_68_17]|nr:MAG: DUF309 domain-containing protein [Halobacteriales archaeon QS_1_68_17]